MKIWRIFVLSGCLAGLCLGQQNPPALDKAYRLQTGDALTVTVKDLPGGVWEGVVNGEGNIVLPFVDKPVVALCRTAEELKQDITKRYQRLLRSPEIDLVAQPVERVTPPTLMLGAVVKPSRFLFKRRVLLSELLAAAGGPSAAAGKNVRVVPTVPLTRCDDANAAPQRELYASLLYPLDAVLRHDEKADAPVYAGDVVTVLDKDLVYVNGFVAQPLALPYTNGLTLWQAVSAAGGFATDANLAQVQIIRRANWNSPRQEITVDLRAITKGAAQDTPLQPNDAISVPCKSCQGRAVKCETCVQSPAQKDLMQTIRTLPLKVIE